MAIMGVGVVKSKYSLPNDIEEFFVKRQNDISLEDVSGSIDKVSTKLSLKTVYFVHNKDTNVIEHIFIELLNCKNSKIMLLTVPNSTKVTLSIELYNTMKDTYVSAPQIMKLSMLTHYFTMEDAFSYGVKILEDAFRVHIDNYVTMDLESFEQVFTKEKDDIIYLKEEWMNWANMIVTQKDTMAKMKSFYDIMTNMDYSMDDRLPYLETYEKLTEEDFIFKQIEGEQKNDSFVPDVEIISRNILEFCQL